MKRYVNVVIIGLLMVIAAPGMAQDASFGLKAGTNFSKIAVNPELDAPSPCNKLGVHIGGFVEFALSEQMSLRPEVSWSSQGGNDEDAETRQTIRITYLNVASPFLYNLEKVSLFVSPQIGFLLDGEFEEEDMISGEVSLIDHSMVYSSMDIALGVGATYDINDQLGIDVRYNIGLTDNNNDPNEEGFYAPSQTLNSRVLQLSVSYSFGK